MKMKSFPPVYRSKLFLRHVLCAATLFLGTSAGFGQTTWQVGGTDKNWSTINNWSGGASPAGTAVVFGAAGVTASSSGTTNIVDTSYTGTNALTSLTYNGNSANWQVTQITSPVTLAVNGAFTVGGLSGASQVTKAAFAGSGTLVINNSSSTMSVGNGGATSANAILDMSALSTFNATVSALNIGTAATGFGTLYLADNSTITASTLSTGGGGSSYGSAVSNKLYLGTTTVLNVDTLNLVGNRTYGSIKFRASGDGAANNTTVSNATLTIRGSAGGSSRAAIMTIGDMTGGAPGSGGNNSVNLTGGSVDAMVGTLTVGRSSGALASTANVSSTLSMASGTFDATTVVVGETTTNTAGTGTMTGNLTVSGGTFNAGTLTLANNGTGASNNRGTVGNLNVSGSAAVNVAGNLVMGVRSGVGTVTPTVNVSNGALTVGGNLAEGAGSASNILSTVNLSGGTLTVTGTMSVDTFSFTGGSLRLGNGGATGSVATGLAIGTGANAGNFIINRNNAVVQGTDFSGAAISGSLSFTQAGSGTTTLNASNTYTGATNIQNGVLVVNGSLANTPVSVGDGTATTRTPTLSGTGSIAGLVTTQVNGSNVAHLAAGVNTSGNTGAIGTLTLSNGLTIGAGTNLDYDLAGGSSGDLIRISGGTLTLNSGITLNIADAGSLGNGTFTLFDYTGASLTGYSASDFSVGTTPLAGKTYTFADTGSSITLTIADASGATSTTYTLTASAGSTNILTGGTTSITSTVTNTGTGTADTLNYAGLGAGSAPGGSIAGSTTSGTGLAQGASGTNASQVFTGTSSGAVVITPAGTGTNATAGGAATATGTTSVTVNVYDPASLSATQSGTGNLITVAALNASGTFRASAKVTADNGLSNNQGFTDVAVAPGTQIDPGNSVTVASFDKTNRLNGTYTAQKGLVIDHVTGGGGAISGGTNFVVSVPVSVSVNGQTAGAGQTFTATLFSGQKYGTTTGSTSSGYGLTSNIASDPHSGTTATLINGTASANTTVSMSFNTVPSAGAIHDTTFRTSDILSLGGIVATGTLGPDHSVLTDKYVLQLSYDPSAVGAQYIGWYDADQSQWVNAIAGDSTGGHYDGSGEFVGSYADYLATLTGPQQADLAFQLNAFGYDVSTHTAWAVMDHNSEFAVIPEPGTWGMILSGFGMLIGIQRLRRRRVGT